MKPSFVTEYGLHPINNGSQLRKLSAKNNTTPMFCVGCTNEQIGFSATGSSPIEEHISGACEGKGLGTVQRLPRFVHNE